MSYICAEKSSPNLQFCLIYNSQYLFLEFFSVILSEVGKVIPMWVSELGFADRPPILSRALDGCLYHRSPHYSAWAVLFPLPHFFELKILHFSFLKRLYFVLNYMSLCGCEHVRAMACRDQKIRQILWSWCYIIPTCKLGAERGSSAGAAGAVNCWALPPPTSHFSKCT